MVSVIGGESRRLSRLIDNLLELSRLQAGAAQPRREWCSVEEMLGEAVAELRAGEDQFSLSIDRDLAAGEPRPGADGAGVRERARERPPPLGRAAGVGAGAGRPQPRRPAARGS